MIVIIWNHIHVNMREDNFSVQVEINRLIFFYLVCFFKCHFGQRSGCVCMCLCAHWCMMFSYLLPSVWHTHRNVLNGWRLVDKCRRVRVLRKGKMCHTRGGNGWANRKNRILCSICIIRISTVVDDNFIGAFFSLFPLVITQKFNSQINWNCPFIISIPYWLPQIVSTTLTRTHTERKCAFKLK